MESCLHVIEQGDVSSFFYDLSIEKNDIIKGSSWVFIV